MNLAFNIINLLALCLNQHIYKFKSNISIFLHYRMFLGFYVQPLELQIRNQESQTKINDTPYYWVILPQYVSIYCPVLLERKDLTS